MSFSNKRKEGELENDEDLKDTKSQQPNCKKLTTSVSVRYPLLEITNFVPGKPPELFNSNTISISSCDLGSDECKITIFKNLSCCLYLDDDIWNEMCLKDLESMERLDPDYISRHPSLQSYFRAVLLDWIIEVCDLYNLNRETYYMTVDYIDRYLTLSSGHPRSELQLLGITSLFVASKIEEIDPPPLADLVYIADDSFSAKDIVEMEYKLLEIVGWSHTKWTANKWLNLYLHMTGLQIGRCEFSLMTRLLDLSSLDVHCLSFSNRILGATCLRLAVQQSLPAGLLPLLPDITSCSEWMAVYWEVIQNSSEDMYQGSKRVYFNQCKVFRNLELNHKYTSYISLYEKGQELIKDETVLPLFTFSAEAVYSQ